MHEEEVEVIEAQVFSAFRDRQQDVAIAVHVVPDLRRDEQVLALDAAGDGRLQASPIRCSLAYTDAQSTCR